MTYEHHPASEMFPMMTGDDLKALADDIRENGQREPIVLLDGKILDGRNRAIACEAVGVTPRTIEFDNWVEPEVFVVSANLHRRHLTAGQKAMIADRLKPAFTGAAKARMAHGPNGAGLRVDQRSEDTEGAAAVGRVNDITGAVVGVSGAAVAQASAVRKANPSLAQKVESGEVPLRSAYDTVKRKPTTSAASKRKKQLGDKQQRRIFDALGVMRGACRGLQETNFHRLLMSATEKEVGEMLAVISAVKSDLGKFERRLKHELSENSSAEGQGE